MTDAQPADAREQERDFFHNAAQSVAKSQLDKLLDAWKPRADDDVTDDMRKAFMNIVWQCSGQTVETLVAEFTRQHFVQCQNCDSMTPTF